MNDAISQTAFENLLAALAADREEAGARYVELRENLVRFFTWRGASEPDAQADETLNRAARKLEDETEKIEDLRRYAFGIARLLCLEINRRDEKQQRAHAELPRLYAEDESEKARREIRLDCLENCLLKFDAADKNFVLAYYQGERAAKIENRKKLQVAMQMSAGAFRMKALRLRERLEQCVAGCCRVREK